MPHELENSTDIPEQPVDAALLLRMSEVGLFPDLDAAGEQLAERTSIEDFIRHLKKRNHKIRIAKLDDLPDLVNLEEQCWPPGQRALEIEISERLAQYPEGQLVLEAAGVVAGVIYSQRLSSEDISGVESTNAHRLHQAGAPVAHILSLNVQPILQHYQFGEQLLEFMLQYCTAMDGVHSVIGVTRCKDYGKHPEISLEDYIFLEDENGRLVDSVLRLHQLHGAEVIRLVRGYRPTDKVNRGCGVLARYELRERKQRVYNLKRQHPVGANFNSLNVNIGIDALVTEAISSILGNVEASAIPMDQPLFELGLDSADLLNLNERIGTLFGIALQSGFLFENNTCRKIVNHFRDNKSGAVQSSPCDFSTHPDSAVDGIGDDTPVKPTTKKEGNAVKKSVDKDVAIIGYACRLPGGIVDAEGLWDFLEKGESAISELPQDRWKWPSYIDPQGQHRGIQRGGFLNDVTRFDAGFFRISPKEAELMDPQQRILLELSWECLEHAGYAKRTLIGSKTGVFVGASGSDYQLRLAERAGEIDAHFGLGTSMAVLANRISYYYDWNGPSIQIDSACSSSLVAMHEAVKALRTGECEQAMVAGINIMCHPATTIAFYKAGMLSADGQCKSFDQGSNGYVRGEGAVVMLLKPLAKAIKEGDQVCAVIKGSAVNHGGQAAGLTVPNPAQQAELIVQAHSDASIDSRTIGYVEAHGTGTRLGDPIEVQGLRQAFGNDSIAKHHRQYYCGLGSVKSNIGHLEAAAGIAGLLKAILCLRHGKLPSSLHVGELNAHISLLNSPFYIVNRAKFWEPHPSLSARRAGVSSFGSGGTNAHVVLEEYIKPKNLPSQDGANMPMRAAIVLSAKTSEQLHMRVGQLLGAIRRRELADADLADIAYTLQMGREPMELRLAVFVNSIDSLEDRLDSWARGQHDSNGIYFNEAARKNNIVRDSPDTHEAPAEQEYLRTGDMHSLLESWVQGREVNWQLLWRDYRPSRITLPTYRFAGKRYWLFEAQGKSNQPSNNPLQRGLSNSYTPEVTKRTAEAVPISRTDHSSQPNGSSSKIVLQSFMKDSEPDRSGSSASIKSEKLAFPKVALVPIANASTASQIAPQSKQEQIRGAMDSNALHAHLIASLAEALYLHPGDIDIDEQFTDMGLDSISGVEWVRMINRHYGTAIPATMVYGYPNVRSFESFLSSELKTVQPRQSPIDRHDSQHADSNMKTESPDSESSPDSSILSDTLAKSLAEALYLQLEDIDIDEQLTDMGLDSISGVEWIRTINRIFGVSIPATMVYAYPNIRQFTNFLELELKKTGANPNVEAAGGNSVVDPMSEMKSSSQHAEPISSQVHPKDDATHVSSENDKDAVAIVGMSGRYAGAATLDELWSNLLAGKSAIKEIPISRWDTQNLYDATPFTDGKSNSKWLGILDDVECFDPLFFGISPAEAHTMDPQHRLFLQEAYKALEHGGYTHQKLNGSQCGVYLGISNNEYAQLLRNCGSGIADRIGNSTAIAAARIAYYLNLKGPAIAIDTACSSSLVATHLACQALLNNEVDLALAGGVSLYLTPELYICMSAAGMLSPDGKCKAFDNGANGIVPGEGVGVMLLKRLSEAVADGDMIYGVISASGINQDGKTNGITAPSLDSQRDLVARIYKEHQIDPASISYVEMHGTGTKLGDPIELEALSAAFGLQTDRRNFCAIGAVKNNIGHTSAVAGIASVHKVLLALKHEQIPPTVNFSEPNEHFDFSSSPFYVNCETMEWKAKGESRLRRAAVSSFGISGTNAHVVIDEYRNPQKISPQASKDHPALIVLSARTHEQLIEYVRLLKACLTTHPCLNLHDVAYTLQACRKTMAHRMAIVAESHDMLQKALGKIVDGGLSGITPKGAVALGFDGIKLLDDDADTAEMIRAWMKKGQLKKLAALWENGFEMDWRLLHQNKSLSKVELPTYPFAKERYWILNDISAVAADNSNGKLEKHANIADENLRSLQTEADDIRNSASEKNRGTLENFLVQMLWIRLRSAGWFTTRFDSLQSNGQLPRLLPLYSRWMQETCQILADAGYLEYDGNGFVSKPIHLTDEQFFLREWEKATRIWACDPALGAQLDLVQATLRELPAILLGNLPATEVMFPAGTLDLVGNVYKNSHVGKYINVKLGQEVESNIKSRLKADPSSRIRIIEIGAGTGGTTQVILDVLRTYSGQIQEYCYTDVSRGFLIDAQDKFGADHSFLRFEKFDVEKSPAAQGINIGHYDIAIAANVIHATRNIRNAVTHVKQVLAPEGVLLLNEMSGKSAFRHLTFGLLEGWWLFEDGDLRIRNCPGLDAAGWRAVLEEQGFQSIRFPVEPVHDLGYQLVIAQNGESHKGQQLSRQMSGEYGARKNSASGGPSEHVSKVGIVETSSDLDAPALNDAAYRCAVEQLLSAAISSVLKLPSEEIQPDLPFSSYGVDSITGIRLVRHLNKTLNVDLNSTVLFDYATIRQLSAHIASDYKVKIAHPEFRKAMTPTEYQPGAGGVVDKPELSSPSPVKAVGPAFVQVPIAVIGMSGLFPQSENIEELWEHLTQGHDLVQPIKRWNPMPNTTEFKNGHRQCCKHAALLEKIDEFDPLFFNISAVEATYMDPAQRLFLQEAWRALEDAGYAGPGMKGRRCGVYVGAVTGDYRELIEKQDAPAQAMLGNASSMMAARIAYHLDLQGPAIVIDTACSSSLVAIHLACQGLWTGEAELALAGGAFVQCTPRFVHSHNVAGMLSVSGSCNTFDASADGFVFGEGVGVIVLKPLAAAIADGDNIYGVICGSGVNQDGATNGISAPSAKSQERLQCDVYDRFHINPDAIQYVEAHGTGTKLGDPIEYQALTKAFRRYSERVGYCAIGSIKSNMGHAAHAAGIAGFIKLMMSLRHKKIPASLHYTKGNSHIQFEGSPFFVNTELRDWKVPPGQIRRAAISAFGLSGTNAHIVVEAPPPATEALKRPDAYLFTLSAKSLGQLRSQVERLLSYSKKHPDTELGNISFTLLNGRGHFHHRFACVVASQSELVHVLQDWVKGNHGNKVFSSGDRIRKMSGNSVIDDEVDACMQKYALAQCTNELIVALTDIARLYANGAECNFEKLFKHHGFKRISLPTYPFARERYWIEETATDFGEIDSATDDMNDLYDGLIEELLDGSSSVEDVLNKVKQLESL